MNENNFNLGNDNSNLSPNNGMANQVPPMNNQPMTNQVPPVQPVMNQVPPMNNQPMMNQVPPMNNQPMMNQVPPTNQQMPPQMSQQPSMATGTKKNNKTLFIILGVVAAIVVAVACLFIFKGGSDKVLTCTMNQEESGMKMTAVANINFKNDKADKVNMKMTIELGELASYKDAILESFESQFDDYKDQGIDVKISSTDKDVIVDMSATKEKMEEAGQITTSADTYKQVKADLEEEGFTCK